MRRFFLATPGLSDRIGEGVCFSDGAVALRFTGHVPATVVHHSVEGMLYRHALLPDCVQWLDPEPLQVGR